jgi:mono/diheme cytochrome c family protein
MADSLTDPGRPGPAPVLVRRDRFVKIALLIGSAVTLSFLVAAMVRENFFAPWRHHQRRYREMLLASDDERQRRLGQEFQIEVRQVDLPQVGTVDRCVSCHVGLDNPAMASAPQPYRPHSGEFLKHHPVERYGCTVCHQGQGAATDFREAKATDVFWDYPLLPARLTQSSCGVCHAADSPLMARHAPELALGRRLFLDHGCLGCHKLDGVGGQLGPALDGIGSKIKHELPMSHVQGDRTLPRWLKQHFDNPQTVVPGSQMRPPHLTYRENEALTIYMLSLRKRDLPKTYIAADHVAALNDRLHHPVKDPAVLYRQLCAGCHGDGTHGTWDRFFNRFMPAIRGPGLRAVADRKYLQTAIEAGRPGTLMPAWDKTAGGLSAEQVSALVNYLLEGTGEPAQSAPSLASVTGGDPRRGCELFTQLCTGCHANNKLAPTLGNTVFHRSATDDFLARTIRNGRTDTAMPAFQREGTDGLTDREINDLVAYLRSLGRK